MTDLKLSEDWDLEFDDSGDLSMVSGIRETSQSSRFRLQLIRGECFEDTNLGVPWLTDMVNPQVSIDAKKQILTRAILSSPGAISIATIEVGMDTEGRLAVSNFSGLAEDGEFSG